MSFDATDLALNAAIENASDKGQVGAFVSVELDEENRLANYLFEAKITGYEGWRWSVTVAKVDEDSTPTICDVVMIPGPDALLAPKWITYADRLQPGDVGVGDHIVGRIARGQHGLVTDRRPDRRSRQALSRHGQGVGGSGDTGESDLVGRIQERADIR